MLSLSVEVPSQCGILFGHVSMVRLDPPVGLIVFVPEPVQPNVVVICTVKVTVPLAGAV